MRSNPYLVNLIMFACYDIIFTFLLFYSFGDMASTIIFVVGIILRKKWMMKLMRRLRVPMILWFEGL